MNDQNTTLSDDSSTPDVDIPGPDEVKTALRKGWSAFVAMAVILILLGVAAIALPVVASVAVVWVLGVVLLVGGIVRIAHALAARHVGGFWGRLLSGVVMGAVGIGLLAAPGAGMVVITFLLAAVFIISGVFKLAASSQFDQQGLLIFDGVISLILGILILVPWPGDSDWVLGLLVGIELIFTGMTMFMMAMAWKKAGA
jgi:uncharacterized membrane protein HdeD (DUF308 family)